jgi:hypothetical protein
MVPSLQVLPSATGHTVNLGVPRYSAEARESFTSTSRPEALVLQTQTANVAVCPALTSEELDKDWTRTQSWATAAFFLGFGDALGVGVGVLLGDGLVVGVGVGVGEVGFFVDVLADGVGSDDLEGDALVDVLGEAEVLAEALGLALVDLLGLAVVLVLVGVGDLLPDLLGVALALAEVRPCVDTMSALSEAARVEFFGTDPQAALTIGPAAEFVASASPDMQAVRNANPVRAPITTGLASCALNPRTSLRCFFWPERAFALTLCTANLKVTSNPK